MIITGERVERRDVKGLENSYLTPSGEIKEKSFVQQTVYSFASLDYLFTSINVSSGSVTATQDFIATNLIVDMYTESVSSNLKKIFDVSLNGQLLGRFTLVKTTQSFTSFNKNLDIQNIRIKQGDILSIAVSGDAGDFGKARFTLIGYLP